VREVMHDARLGKAVQVENVGALVDDITQSVVRNSGALLAMLRLKNKDDYTFLHCVSVGTLMVTFGRALGLEGEVLRQAGIGGFVHDVGKTLVPETILNKPGRLTDGEFLLIKRHPAEGHQILKRSSNVGEAPLDITLHHHERMDGKGYPEKLPEARISQLARMAAIVDVYDAITSDRPYHRGIAPTEALRKMLEWCNGHFDEALLRKFIRCIGIYPTGTLVRLDNGWLAVVTEQNGADLLRPAVRAFFCSETRAPIAAQDIDLARADAPHIVADESPQTWGVDPLQVLASASQPRLS
jgi:HD-GYP domain-containing protein (c-di-GMP phosphodiesterase class II)